jgi:hypothetical protein
VSNAAFAVGGADGEWFAVDGAEGALDGADDAEFILVSSSEPQQGRCCSRVPWPARAGFGGCWKGSVSCSPSSMTDTDGDRKKGRGPIQNADRLPRGTAGFCETIRYLSGRGFRFKSRDSNGKSNSRFSRRMSSGGARSGPHGGWKGKRTSHHSAGQMAMVLGLGPQLAEQGPQPVTIKPPVS